MVKTKFDRGNDEGTPLSMRKTIHNMTDKDAYIRSARVLSRLLVWRQQTGKSWTEPTFHEPRKRSEAKLTSRQRTREGRTGQGSMRTNILWTWNCIDAFQQQAME